MVKTEKQLAPRPPRPMAPEEVLVLFAVDSNIPPVDDDVFEETFHSLASALPDRVWFGSWKLLRISGMTLVPPSREGEPLKLPAPVVAELRSWEESQSEPETLKIVRIRELPGIQGYALVIVAEDAGE